MYNVNYKSCVNVSQVITSKMIQEGRPGSVVFVSSQASLIAMPNHLAYGSFKAALDLTMKTMAVELGKHQIRVNSVNPTVTLTQMAKEFWLSDPAKSGPALARIPLGRFAGTVDNMVTSFWFT